jgi:uncharacterized protein YbjT (DUF2867 family)
MSASGVKILVVGATGSIGRQVVEQALRDGHRVRALTRDRNSHSLPREVEVVIGDLTLPPSLPPALDDIDAIVFTHGTYGSVSMAEAVDYGGVRNVLDALGRREARIALMTAIGVTDRKGAHDWKRRAERMVRASGLPYTIVRPAWFDYNSPQELRLVLLQGDTRRSGSPRDGVVARRQVAQVLVRSLTLDAAVRKTFELVAEAGPETQDFHELFATTDADEVAGLDGVHDAPNMPVAGEPLRVLDDLERVRAQRRGIR